MTALVVASRGDSDLPTIIRDEWGIPHVYGKTDADAVFGVIYAQAEAKAPKSVMVSPATASSPLSSSARVFMLGPSWLADNPEIRSHVTSRIRPNPIQAGNCVMFTFIAQNSKGIRSGFIIQANERKLAARDYCFANIFSHASLFLKSET